MHIDLSKFLTTHQTIGVALSGGGDSMALLHYLLKESKIYNFSVIAINVEHGIRGAESIKDTEFVINYCKKDCPTPSTSDANGRSSLSSELQSSYRCEVPKTTPFGWVNWLEGFAGLIENILLTRLLTYYKKACSSGTARCKKCIRKV